MVLKNEILKRYTTYKDCGPPAGLVINDPVISLKQGTCHHGAMDRFFASFPASVVFVVQLVLPTHAAFQR